MDIGIFGARGVPSTYGGYETFLTTLAPALVERGHTVTVYCRPTDSAESPGTTWRGVHRHTLASVPTKSLSTLSHGFISAFVARKANHDVVLAVNVANAPFCSFLKAGGTPVVLNTDGEEWERGKWGRVARSVFMSSARSARRATDALIADSREMERIYRQRFHAPATVIPYCAPSEQTASTSSLLAGLDLTPGRYFLVAGRHTPENHLDTIASRFVESSLDVPLIVLGTANYRSGVSRTIERLAETDPRVRWLGHVGDRADYFALVVGARGYLHGHTVGGTNPALVEAMSIGARIGAHDNRFNRETLGGSGDFFTYDNASLVEWMRTVLDESERDHAFARARVRERAERRFGYDAVVDAYEQLLERVAARPSSRRWRNDILVMETEWSRPEVDDADVTVEVPPETTEPAAKNQAPDEQLTRDQQHHDAQGRP